MLARCASDSWGLSPGKLQSCMLMFTGLPLKPFNGLLRFEGLGTSISMALQAVLKGWCVSQYREETKDLIASDGNDKLLSLV